MKKIYRVYPPKYNAKKINAIDGLRNDYRYQSISQLECADYAREKFIQTNNIYPIFECSISDTEYYDFKAVCYAEKYGIIEYTIKDDTMIYYTAFPMERRTYKVIVNLETLKESRHALKRYFKPYKHIGKTQVNYAI